MGFLRDLSRKLRKLDPVGNFLLKATERIPGSPGALAAAIESDAPSGNLFGPEASKFDIFAGGTKLSKSKTNRAVGRAVGSFIAAGPLGAGASASTAAQLGAGAAATSLGASAAADAEGDARIADDEARAADDAAAAGASEAAAKASADAERLARAARDRADSINLTERRRRQVFSRSVNPTGGAGDLSRANLASKFLLGV